MSRLRLSTSSTIESAEHLESRDSSRDMNDGYALTNLEKPLRPGHSGNEPDTAFVSAEERQRDQQNHSTPEHEIVDQSKVLYASSILELKHESTTKGRSPNFDHRRKTFVFVRRNPSVLAALTFGMTSSLGSFAYLFWLSHQTISCPLWAVDCHAKHSLGLIQGVLSSIYGMSIASIAYAAYRFAETTLWPMLTEQPLSLEAIDRYVAHVRGSLVSFPFAAWYMRRSVSISYQIL